MGHLKRLVQCGLDLYFFLLADSVRPAHDSETKVISTVDQIYNSQLDLINTTLSKPACISPPRLGFCFGLQ